MTIWGEFWDAILELYGEMKVWMIWFFFISSEWIHSQLKKTNIKGDMNMLVEKATIFSKFHGSSQSFLVLPSLERVHIPLPKSRHVWRYHDFPEPFPFGGICMLVPWKVPYKDGCKDVFDTGTIKHCILPTRGEGQRPFQNIPTSCLHGCWTYLGSQKRWYCWMVQKSGEAHHHLGWWWTPLEISWNFNLPFPQLVRSAGFLNRQPYQLCRSVDFCWKQ